MIYFDGPARHFALWSCFTFVMTMTGIGSAADTVPLWKKGISVWGGDRYTLPPGTARPNDPPASNASSSGPASSSVPAVKKNPYTVPVDPALAMAQADVAVGKGVSADVAWLESFVSGDVVAALATSNSKSPEAAAVAQVAAQAGPLPSLPQLEPPLNLGVIEPGEIDSITQRIAAGEEIDAELPLQEQVTKWYQYPWIWMTTGWTNHAELGLNGSDGNATTTSLTAGIHLKRKTDIYILGLDLDHRQASNRGETTQDNGRFNVDYDRNLADSRWTAFAKYAMEWDQFKAFDLRLSTNAGLGYYWIKDEKGLLITRFGAGASKELGAPDDRTIPEAVFGIEAERQITARQKIKGKIDYFPSWEDFTDFRLVADASWEMLLDGTDNLSVKLSATDRYDSTPQGAVANDIYYAALLLYKF